MPKARLQLRKTTTKVTKEMLKKLAAESRFNARNLLIGGWRFRRGMTQPGLDGLDYRPVCFVKHLTVTEMQALLDAPDPPTSDDSRDCAPTIS